MEEEELELEGDREGGGKRRINDEDIRFSGISDGCAGHAGCKVLSAVSRKYPED